MVRRLLPFVFGLVATSTQVAASEPSTCVSSGSFVEDLICRDSVIFDLDQRVDSRFSQAVRAAEALEEEARRATNNLRDEQARFLRQRRICLNTVYPRACIFGRYERREAYLVARWNLEAPVTQTVWECEGLDIQELRTVEFDTGTNSIRFEDGDTVAIGFRKLSSDGHWYVGDFGQSILFNGENATYIRPFPKPTEYTCRVAQTN